MIDDDDKLDVEQENDLWEKAVFGRQVEEFLSSDIGKFLLDKAQEEYYNAIQQLRDCKPEDLLRYQSDMKRAESVRDWLIQAVEEGLRALNMIEEAK